MSAMSFLRIGSSLLIALLFGSTVTCLQFSIASSSPTIIINWARNTTDPVLWAAVYDLTSGPFVQNWIHSHLLYPQDYYELSGNWSLPPSPLMSPVNLTIQGVTNLTMTHFGPQYNFTLPLGGTPDVPSIILPAQTASNVGPSIISANIPAPTSVPAATSPPSVVSAKRPSSDLSSLHDKAPTIAGTVIGTVTFLLLLLATILWLRRRGRFRQVKRAPSVTDSFDRDKMVREGSGIGGKLGFEPYGGRVQSVSEDHPCDSLDTVVGKAV